jgi:hypothetical protein
MVVAIFEVKLGLIWTFKYGKNPVIEPVLHVKPVFDLAMKINYVFGQHF